jgi:PAT family beta-lactamase induction signal transducer AmpG
VVVDPRQQKSHFMNSFTLPSLGTSRRLRFFAFTSFYVAQGLPIGLIQVAIPAWLAVNGADVAEVATFVAISTLPWGFKLLAGPMMDRFRFPTLGGRRPWVLMAQTGLLLSLLVLAIVGGSSQDVMALTWWCFLVNSFAAIQDVAVDGMAIDVLHDDERGRANAMMAFGQVAGYAGSGALSAWGLATFGVSQTAAMLTVGIALILLVVVLLRERDGEKLLPWTKGSVQHQEHLLTVTWGAIVGNLVRTLLLPASLILIAATTCWRLSDGIFMTAIPVLLTQQLGWESTDYSYWYSNSSFVAALVGVFLGPFIDRLGAHRFFIGGLAAAAVIYLALGLTTDYWEHSTVWIVGLFAVNFAIQVVFIAFIALHMTVCWKKVAATQFAVYMAWSNLARSFGAQTYGELSPYLEMGQESLLMAGLCLLGAILLLFVNLDRHRERLGRLHVDKPAEDALTDIPARN